MVVVAGPTGSGKTALALALAAAFDGEIIGCDSVQVYRGFDIGSAKATAAERAAVPHHLIDVVDWQEDFDAARYAQVASAAIEAIRTRKRLPIVVGGTGLYLRALLREDFHEDLPSDAGLRAELRERGTEELYERLKKLDPQRAGAVHPNDRVRVVRALELVTLLGKPLHEVTQKEVAGGARRREAYVIVLDPPRAALHAAIAGRTKAMLKDGILEETRALLTAGVTANAKPMQSIGYKQCAELVAGALQEAELEGAIVAATRQYAKRQCTWYRRVEAELRLVEWDVAAVVETVRAEL